MTEPTPGEGTEGSVADYASALNELRDSLISLSLAARDFMFEVDSLRRAEVSASTDALLEKIKRV
jgi:hypothetical protein